MKGLTSTITEGSGVQGCPFGLTCEPKGRSWRRQHRTKTCSPGQLGSLRDEEVSPLLPGNELSNGWTWYLTLLALPSHKDSAQPPTRCMISGKSSDSLSLSFLNRYNQSI